MTDFVVVVCDDPLKRWWQFWRRPQRFTFTGEMRLRVWQRQGGGSRGMNGEPLEVQGMTTSDDATSLVVSFGGQDRLKRILGRPPVAR